MDNAACVFKETGTAYPSGLPEFIPVFVVEVRIFLVYMYVCNVKSCSCSRDCHVFPLLSGPSVFLFPL